MDRQPAYFSIDLDNLWAYLKANGDSSWNTYPTYMTTFLPHFLSLLKQHNLHITFFLVGQDAQMEQHQDLFKEIVANGHTIANHSFSHSPHFHKLSKQQLEEEILRAEESIHRATGIRTVGFRAPCFAHSKTLIDILGALNYSYDSSTLPTFIAPLARLKGCQIQGSLTKNTFHQQQNIQEYPVTTLPFFRTPFHMSYLVYLYSFSPKVMRTYLKIALKLCQATKTPPNFLLHPTDFLSTQEAPQLSFFPGMTLSAEIKTSLFHEVIDTFKHNYCLKPLQEALHV
ncbi:MAG: polysaccharide deacetylase family protein [Chlamydiia bacterium]|nr:polysaccharide deacetylase family protein [Chlamydiia bacterium]